MPIPKKYDVFQYKKTAARRPCAVRSPGCTEAELCLSRSWLSQLHIADVDRARSLRGVRHQDLLGQAQALCLRARIPLIREAG